ncbi:GMC family oxidoreductase [Pantoea sp. 1.19]|uniref:GMC family oxidoreductase n=1 Tax=Pantoea sp. 1.19 TaxID=1925589 RepID=UPI000948CA1F|nr:GMC family oxidoreductase [Pantoea sp. 1.19]
MTAYREHYDFIVVGGGTAGCVMASRLSANEHATVLLIESGEDSQAREAQSPLNDASRLVLEHYNWSYEANVHGGDRFAPAIGEQEAPLIPGSRRKPFAYRLGKVLGGSSAINGAVALRGFPGDFACWAAAGAPRWDWPAVLPWYKMLENDRDCGDSALHGGSGPLTIRRPADADILPVERAFATACQAQGTPWVTDFNAGEQPAVGAVPANVLGGSERYDFCRAYLMPTRGRKNLDVITRATAERVLFHGQRASGIEIRCAGKHHLFRGTQLVLCAGAVGSPALLQRSGVGDARLLQRHAIPVQADNPAIGNHLSDHASVVLWALPRAENSRVKTPWRQTAARLASGVDHQVDVQLGLMNNIASDTVPGFLNRTAYPSLVGASVMLMRPQARGRVFIRSRHSSDLPAIDLPLTRHPEDIRRLAGGVRKMWQLLQHPELHACLDGIQFWNAGMIDNDDVLHNAVKNLVSPGWHACGTVRMGSAGTADIAADEHGRVLGVSHLTVADASLFPCIPSMPTNLTTAMVAERLAADLLKEYRL